MLPDPVRQLVLVHCTGGDGEYHEHALPIVRRQFISVQKQKGFQRDQRDALVAIDEGVVLCKPEAVRRGELGRIGLSIGREVLRTRERGLEQATVANAARAAMLGQLLVMCDDERLRIQPNPVRHGGYFASSFNASRRLFITARIVSSCLAFSSS